MADQSGRKTEQTQKTQTGTASVGEEVRSHSVTGGTNGGTSNRPDYEPEGNQIAPDEPGGTEGHGKHK